MIGAKPMGWVELLIAAGFLLVSGGISVAMSLGMLRTLSVAAFRAYAQLLLLGLALRWIFGVAHPLLVLGVLSLMVVVATQTLLARLRLRPPGFFLRSGAALLISGGTVTFAVTGLVIGADPWYDPRTVIPIAGMVLGNSMNGIAICLDRLFADLAARRTTVDALLALGAEPWEATRDAARAAMRAGLIPTVNSMSAAGIVFIPGMMTGQVLSGTDPGIAAVYQIVVLLMISAATALGAALALYAGSRKAFDGEGRMVWPPADASGKTGSG